MFSVKTLANRCHFVILWHKTEQEEKSWEREREKNFSLHKYKQSFSKEKKKCTGDKLPWHSMPGGIDEINQNMVISQKGLKLWDLRETLIMGPQNVCTSRIFLLKKIKNNLIVDLR